MPSAGVLTADSQEDNDLSLTSSAGTPANTGFHAMSVQAPNSDSTLAAVLKSLNEDKGENIVQIDLHGKSEMGDYMVIASGRSSRQVSAMAEKLTERLKQTFGILCKVEGRATGDWVLIDTGDVIVHVFRPEVREFYQLEKMWQNPGEATAEHNAAEAAKRTT